MPASTSPPNEATTLDVYASVGLASGGVLLLIVAIALMNVSVFWCWIKRTRARETKPPVLYDYIHDPPTCDPRNILETTNPAYTTTSPLPVSTNEAYGMCAANSPVSSATHVTINGAYGADTADEVHVYEECDTATDDLTSTNEAYASTTAATVYDN